VHKGIINVEAIDKNKDGKVYQDQMDWNVISDKPGTCPLCKMTLEEVTVKKAKENLKNNGFKVK
jgi:transcription initiation factor IIE alpha subunit